MFPLALLVSASDSLSKPAMHLSTASGEVEGALVKTAPWIRTSETIPTDSRQAKRSKRHGGTVVSVLLARTVAGGERPHPQ